jgi:osmotically-inducible protein OsmY
VIDLMHHAHNARNFRTDTDYGPGWRQERRDTVNDDVAPDDVSLLGPPTRSSTRPTEDLAAYGYAGQGYPIYGQQRVSSPYDDPEPGWFADPASSAYAFGYTTSLRSNDPFPGSERVSRGHAGKGPKDYLRSDARVLEDVCERLSDDDEVDASDISVNVVSGEVTLTGTVVDRYSKRRAEHVAAEVRGVIDVQNRLSTQKGVLRELGDKITGDGEQQHHGHQGSGTHGAPGAP